MTARTVCLVDTDLKEDPPVGSPPSSIEEEIWTRIKLKGASSDILLPKRLVYLLTVSRETLLSPEGPLEWPAVFFPYQLDGIRFLVSRDALLLADDMGLGKTIQGIAALRILIHQRYVESALLVAPVGLLSQWRKEIRAWAPELRISTVQGPAAERAYQWSTPAHVYLTSYETLREDFTANPHSPPRRRIWDVVILDEAQKIKNRDTEVGRKCKLVPRRRAWVLTGTPLENTPDDLASILEFTRPLAQGEKPSRVMPGQEMRAIHKKLQLRRKKADVLPQLPPKTISTIALPLSGDQRETYDRAEKQGILQLKEKGQSVRIENVLELILRLKQLCNFCPTTSESAKLDDVQARLATLVSEGHRALVFSQFTDDRFGVHAVADRLRQFRPLLFTGAMSLQQRSSVVEQFKSDPSHKVLVLSLRAGGQGLNLQEASYVFHFDRWWNPAVEHQAEDRTHRLGQTSPVHVYQYTCEDTIEERIEQILQQKQKLFDELVDDVSIDLKSRLTEEELYGLFGLTPPRRPGGKGNPSTGSG
ncbi:MAG: DEAD/DEAH box helicase [Chloroflexi bacterium]|nr:DEAD/DEAH box helicase [Chloroflexota bacterium]